MFSVAWCYKESVENLAQVQPTWSINSAVAFKRRDQQLLECKESSWCSIFILLEENPTFVTLAACRCAQERWQGWPAASDTLVQMELPCQHFRGSKGFLSIMDCCKAQLLHTLPVVLLQVVQKAIASLIPPAVWVQYLYPSFGWLAYDMGKNQDSFPWRDVVKFSIYNMLQRQAYLMREFCPVIFSFWSTLQALHEVISPSLHPLFNTRKDCMPLAIL